MLNNYLMISQEYVVVFLMIKFGPNIFNTGLTNAGGRFLVSMPFFMSFWAFPFGSGFREWSQQSRLHPSGLQSLTHGSFPCWKAKSISSILFLPSLSHLPSARPSRCAVLCSLADDYYRVFMQFINLVSVSAAVPRPLGRAWRCG